jgi:formylglycine-generating enzyme required for sulfatase activity
MQPCAIRTRWAAICAAALLASGIGVRAESPAGFFRITGPITGVFTRIGSGGMLVWTNSVLNDTCHVQIATSLLGAGSWRDYEHSLVTSAVTTVKMFDESTPRGMSYVPAGIFTMGDVPADHPEGGYSELNEDPVHTVHLDAFYIGAHEVTQGEWDGVRSWALGHGYSIACVGNGKDTNHPVTAVCWHDAVLWCNAKSEMEGLTPLYYTDAAQTTVYRSGALDLSSNAVKWGASGYRLPCEAEWEYAARGGAQGSRFAFGPTISHSQANYYSTDAYAYDVSPTRGEHPAYSNDEPCTSASGAFSANGYGLCDVVGNVSEWCWDRSDGVTETCTDCGGSGTITCPDCGGSGSADCSTCGGSGLVECDTCYGSGTIDITCSDCGGAGSQMCPACGGSGSMDISCPICGGGGGVNCPACGGSGNDMCPSCGGIGAFTCSQCGGSGIGTCGTCSGIGDITCPICGGADPECGTCAGIGTVTCPSCSGTGVGACVTCGGDGDETCSTCGGGGMVDCSVCYGIGMTDCGACGGSGLLNVSCSTCSGIGSIACGPCSGNGYITISCPGCGGDGDRNCSDCGGGGSFTCSTCGGAGDETCSFCSGRGDLWSSVYYSLCGPTDPRGPAIGDKRIVRGGAWNSTADGCRVSRRTEASPSDADSARGFRLLRSAAH